MRVAHLTTVDSSLHFLLLPQLRAVVERGGEAIGISAPGPWVAELSRSGISHRPLPSSTRGVNLWADLRAARELWRLLRSERFDVLHTHNPKPGLYGRILGRLAKVPIVVHTTHGLYATPDDPRVKRALVYLAEAFASRFSDAELVQNEEDLELMTRLRIVRPARAILLGNGVDLSRFHADPIDAAPRRALRAELGIGADRVVVGTVGRLVAEKGFLELFEAIRILGDPYTLVVAGPEDRDKGDALSADTIEAAKDHGVHLLGLREDVEVIYDGLDIFVLASHREGLPRAAMEAAAMGLPIVATDIRGCRQVVEDGVNGFLVPAKDALALADAIRRLGGDKALRREMGRVGAEKARRQFDERNVVDLVMRTYQAVAERSATHP